MKWIKVTDVVKMINTHVMDVCVGRVCIIHAPTEHHMSSWPVLFRADRGIFERVCSHGVGHPDPDQFPFWEEAGRNFEKIHGCDGCCAPVASSS